MNLRVSALISSAPGLCLTTKSMSDIAQISHNSLNMPCINGLWALPELTEQTVPALLVKTSVTCDASVKKWWLDQRRR